MNEPNIFGPFFSKLSFYTSFSNFLKIFEWSTSTCFFKQIISRIILRKIKTFFNFVLGLKDYI
jgi:hypothetical protein